MESTPDRTPEPSVRGWRWRITGGSPVSVTETLNVGVAMRLMLTEASRWSRGSHVMPLCLHGPTPDHSHARYIPEDIDGDGVIDHLTVYASGGLDGVAIRLLAVSERLFVPGHGAHDLAPVWMGGRPEGAMFAEGTAWISRTPWVAPWFKDPSEKQVRKELPHIGLSSSVASTVSVSETPCSGRERNFVFVRADDPPPSPPRARMLQLTFTEPVIGPIVLGYASHFGLGQLIAVKPT